LGDTIKYEPSDYNTLPFSMHRSSRGWQREMHPIFTCAYLAWNISSPSNSPIYIPLSPIRPWSIFLRTCGYAETRPGNISTLLRGLWIWPIRGLSMVDMFHRPRPCPACTWIILASYFLSFAVRSVRQGQSFKFQDWGLKSLLLVPCYLILDPFRRCSMSP